MKPKDGAGDTCFAGAGLSICRVILVLVAVMTSWLILEPELSEW